jgi:hypothetical protein
MKPCVCLAALFLDVMTACTHALFSSSINDHIDIAGMDGDARNYGSLEDADASGLKDAADEVALTIDAHGHHRVIADLDDIVHMKALGEYLKSRSVISDHRTAMRAWASNEYSKSHTESGIDSDQEIAERPFAFDEQYATKAKSSQEAQDRSQEVQYIAEFVVEINLTRARDAGLALGLALDVGTEWFPVSVVEVKEHGLVAEWNVANPGKEVRIHDHITRVNDLQWHRDTSTFVKGIAGQLESGRAAQQILSLHVHRPKDDNMQSRQAGEREDLRQFHMSYAAQFVAEFQMPMVPTDGTVADVMGWELSSKTDQEPVKISNIMEEGALARWNAAHPDDVILQGDQILKVNNVFWDHNSTVFTSSIGQQFAQSRSPGSSGTLALLIRRPWPVQEAFDMARVTQELSSWKSKSFTTLFRFHRSLPGARGVEAIGWQLEAKGTEAPVVVSKVWKEGLVAEWNAQNPTSAVEPKSQVVQVNNMVWREGSNSSEFMRSIAEALEDAAHDGPVRACYFVFRKQVVGNV